MVDNSLAIGVDIGGTKIAFALVDQQGNTLHEHRVATAPEEGHEAIFDRIAAGVELLRAQATREIIGVGIGSPGHLDPVEGIIHAATNLSWYNVPLKQGVRERLKGQLPVWIEKDANAIALGEMYFGVAKGYRDFVYLALGTGLGGGAIANGQLVSGRDHNAMEIGHMPLAWGERLCKCGMRGCPEMYVSGVGLAAGLQECWGKFGVSSLSSANASTAEILQAARDGDALARHLIETGADWLASVMIACTGILNPALFVLGGGLGWAGSDLWIPLTKEIFSQRISTRVHHEFPFIEARVKSSAVGAASIVWFNR